MLSRDLLQRVRLIELRTRRNVHNILTGAYHSIYKGRGMAFSGVRPYSPGDDVRAIDWKVTARSGTPHIKQFVEERELTLMIIVDGSPSVLFGTQDRTKRDYLAEIAAILSYAAMFNQDRVAMLIFGDSVEHYSRPRKGRNHVLAMIRTLLTHQPKSTSSNLASALRIANQVLRRGAIVFIISDFLFPVDEYRQDIRLLAQHHDITCIAVNDPLERSLPDIGLVAMEDMETANIQWADTSSEKWQQMLTERITTQRKAREDLFWQIGVQELTIHPHDDVSATLVKFFANREPKRS